MAPPEDEHPTPGASWGWSAAFRAVSAFTPGEVVAGRFRMVRFLASGGMGEVYEAEDLELKERVALKSIRPEIAEDETVLARFRREIQLARRVTHPSVCRTYDLFRHRLPPPPGWTGPTPEVVLLSMELLEGETLTARIRGQGPSGAGEALPIVEQMAAALAAAHDVGIVHRDFKSGNVMLVPSPKGMRAVVTDFGLARGGGVSVLGRGVSVTMTGAFAGTPEYMAPEQVEGAEITPAADVYALGIVIYEMVTGRLPFEGDTPLAVAISRLSKKPLSPRAHAPSLDPRWEAAILRCLEREPRERFAGPLDVVKALRGEEVPASPKQRRRRRLRTALWSAALVILGLGAALLGARMTVGPPRGPRGAAPLSPTQARRSVAVLGFKNLAGREQAAWMTTALSEMLTMELAGGGRLRTIPGENVARMKVELSLPELDSLAADTLARIGTNLGADLVVLGSYFAAGEGAGGKVRLDVRLQDTARGETVASVSEMGTEAELPEIVARTGARLREQLGIGRLSAEGRGGLRASLPSSPDAARLYAEGLAKLRLFDALAARDLLQKAVAAEPGSPLAHSALGEAWSVLGYDGKAQQEARKAFDLSGGLSREERLSVEGRYREATRDWAKAIEAYATLWNFFPDNLDHGLRVAAAQRSAGRHKDALATIEALRRLPSPASDDPRIDLEEARVANTLADFNRARAMAARAAEKGARQGARLLVAQARLAEGFAYRALGQPERSVAAFEEAKRLHAESGDRGGVAQALLQSASVLRYAGGLAQAKAMAEQSLAISREIGDQASTASALSRIGSVVAEEGRLGEAGKLYQESLGIWRESGEKTGEATVLNNIGEAAWKRGELAGARESLVQSLAIFRGIGNRRGASFALFNLGFVLLDQGDLAAARKRLEESVALSREIGEKSLLGMALFGLGNVRLAEGDLSGARKAHEESLALRSRLEESGRVAESRLGLARVSLAQGRPADASALAREALAEFERESAHHHQALAQAVLAEVLLAQGKIAEARSAIDLATPLAQKSEYRSMRLSVGVTAARVEAATARAAQGVKRLKAVLGEAGQAGFAGLQLEARLAFGEIELRYGDPGAGRAALAALEDEARAKGFLGLAVRARAARGGALAARSPSP